MMMPRLTTAMLWVFASVASAAEPAGGDRQAPPAQAQTGNDGREQASNPEERPATPASTSAAPSSQRGTRADRLDLDTTVVTGNRELPKVLYIVPWKKADIGDLPGQPFNTLLDETLTPVDRDVFRREVTYYGAISGDPEGVRAPAPAAPPATGGSEK